MSELPSSWTWTTIGELSQYIQRGKSPKYIEHSDLPVINQKCIRWNQLEFQHLKFIHPEQFAAWDEARYIAPGDILWNSTGTGTVGRAYLVNEQDCAHPKVVDSHVTIVRSASGIDARYLFSWIKGPAVQSKIEEMCDGTTNQIELSRTAIAATPVPLAPAAEQTRIADQLNTLLARVQTCNDRIDTIPALLKRFRQAVLESTLHGGFLDNAEASTGGEISAPIAAIATVGTGSTPLRSNGRFFASSGTPWVTSAATSNKLITQANEFVTQQAIEAHRLRLYPKGTLLVAMYGEGKTRGQVAELGIEATINQACAAVVVDETKALTAYVKLALQANYLSMRELAEGGNQPNLNLSKVKDFQIPLPSLERQEQIVHKANALLSIADRIEARYIAARAQAQRLTPLLLAKAFRGELVPQDPDDESASVLLKRIAAERAKAATLPRPRKPTAGRKLARIPKENAAMTKSRQDDDVQGQPYLAKHLRLLGGTAPAEALFKASELPVADFYKQLAWEVAQGHLRDGKTVLELADAA